MSSSSWHAPAWIQTFYSKFPLITLDQEDSEFPSFTSEKHSSNSLWIHPPSIPTYPHAHPHYRSWASSHPNSLRTQLLFLLRDTPVEFFSWHNELSAPGEELPVLHLREEDRILKTGEIRGWLDKQSEEKEWVDSGLHGMKDQTSYDKALAIAQLVLNRVYPAYLLSLPPPVESTFHLLFPNPPPLLAGLSTPLPASLTGDTRAIDEEGVLSRGVQAIEALDVLLRGDTWALGAVDPTPLDALIASHLYVLHSLEEGSRLRVAVDGKEGLGDYLDRVLETAGANRR